MPTYFAADFFSGATTPRPVVNGVNGYALPGYEAIPLHRGGCTELLDRPFSSTAYATPEDCAAAAVLDTACGDAVMFDTRQGLTAFNCYCCAPGGAGSADVHPDYQITFAIGRCCHSGTYLKALYTHARERRSLPSGSDVPSLPSYYLTAALVADICRPMCRIATGSDPCDAPEYCRTDAAQCDATDRRHTMIVTIPGSTGCSSNPFICWYSEECAANLPSPRVAPVLRMQIVTHRIVSTRRPTRYRYTTSAAAATTASLPTINAGCGSSVSIPVTWRAKYFLVASPSVGAAPTLTCPSSVDLATNWWESNAGYTTLAASDLQTGAFSPTVSGMTAYEGRWLYAIAHIYEPVADIPTTHVCLHRKLLDTTAPMPGALSCPEVSAECAPTQDCTLCKQSGGLAYVASTSSFSVVLGSSFADAQSGMARYELDVFILPSAAVIATLQAMDPLISITHTLSSSPPPPGTRLRVVARGYNNAGLFSETSPLEYLLDGTPPVGASDAAICTPGSFPSSVPASVWAGVSHFQQSLDILKVCWTQSGASGFHDLESGIGERCRI